MKSTIARFSIRHVQHIDEHGKARGRPPRVSPDTLRRLYRWMMLTRRFDERAVRLQRTGQLGTYASSLGHEALHVGVAAAKRLSTRAICLRQRAWSVSYLASFHFL